MISKNLTHPGIDIEYEEFVEGDKKLYKILVLIIPSSVPISVAHTVSITPGLPLVLRFSSGSKQISFAYDEL